MRRRTVLALSLLFFVPLVLTLPVYAANQTINVTEFPELVADAFNISEIVAGFILSAAVMLSIALPLAYLKARGLVMLVALFTAMSGCIALGWLPYWIMLVVTLIVAALYAGKIKRAF